MYKTQLNSGMLKTANCLFGNNRLKWTKRTKLDQMDLVEPNGLNWTEVDRIQQSKPNGPKWTKKTKWTGLKRPKWTQWSKRTVWT